jgi:hypothetical protein
VSGPKTRVLPVVLRGELTSPPGLSLIVARSLGTKPDNGHLNVQIAGATYKVAVLSSAGTPAAGTAVHVLVTPDSMLALGHVAA